MDLRLSFVAWAGVARLRQGTWVPKTTVAEQANVASIEALEDFRASLVRYRQRTTRALDDVAAEVKRTREWLAFDRRMAWEAEVRRCQRRLDQAEAELATSQLSALKDDHSAQQLAVRKARRALDEAEEKLRRTKKWAREFDAIVDPASRPLDNLRERIANDLPKAIGSLDAMIRALGDYAGRTDAPVRVETKRAEEEPE